MKLHFRIETRKIKQPRIVVLRTMTTKEGESYDKQIGSFNFKNRSPDPIKKLLTPEELYEFENFLATLEFSKKIFGKNADTLDRFIIKSPNEFITALTKIFITAQEYGIDFVPEKEMLYKVLNKAKKIEQHLNLLTNGEFKALAETGIDIADILPPEKSIAESQQLFRAILDSCSTSEKTDKAIACFNKITEKYGKNTKFTKQYLEHYASILPEGKMPSFPKWYFTIAVNALSELGVEPYTVISPTLMIEHWLRLNKQKSEEETIKEFLSQFPKFPNHDLARNFIKKTFMDDTLRKMGNFPDTIIPTPIMSITKWLDHYLKLNKETSVDAIVTAFGKQFPNLKNNKFCIQLIHKQFKIVKKY